MFNAILDLTDHALCINAFVFTKQQSKTVAVAVAQDKNINT
jgi:hypothetical protein